MEYTEYWLGIQTLQVSLGSERLESNCAACAMESIEPLAAAFPN